MSSTPNFVGLSAVVVVGGFLALPWVESRILESERMVIRHESRIDALERRVADLESASKNPWSFEQTAMRRDLALLRERVETLGKRDGSVRGGDAIKEAPPAPAPPSESKPPR